MAAVFIGHGKTILSMETGDFMDGKLFLRVLSIKSGVFVDGQLCLRLAAKKSAIFLAGKIEDKKETPPKGCLCSYLVMRCPIRSGMT